MNKTLITTAILFLSIHCFAQTGNDDDLVSRKQNRYVMKEKIKELKNGALLIRLKTRAATIAALRKAGKPDKADEIEQEQRTYNKEAVFAFRNYFDFCPVYFFFSDQLENVIKKEFEKIVFLNDSLEPDTNIRLTGKHFLTAEFGNIEQDTAKYIDHYSTNTENDRNGTGYYYGGPNMGFDALVIKSDLFIQLKRPFPYYARIYKAGSLKLNLKYTVENMNEKLAKFYESATAETDE